MQLLKLCMVCSMHQMAARARAGPPRLPKPSRPMCRMCCIAPLMNASVCLQHQCPTQNHVYWTDLLVAVCLSPCFWGLMRAPALPGCMRCQQVVMLCTAQVLGAGSSVLLLRAIRQQPVWPVLMREVWQTDWPPGYSEEASNLTTHLRYLKDRAVLKHMPGSVEEMELFYFHMLVNMCFAFLRCYVNPACSS